ncbi:PLP-dependent aminotransferase family protein [Sporolactobacillus shoreicorticis]|uniref:aminotransferase-like domain-containing protein n=1 Tax=Sporolactobacillus shoreicorticis TaxID=1923877 RepID=UPI00209827E7|nr:PLP-dependent aminotransferase family protein [Sporolactobacillus shoreicorticis]MCO7126876.1 PLP-dependent aminotransferase family protein [Sporolactobacillus shoreicorticis]
MKLNRKSPIPLRRQVEAYITNQIATGEWAIGSQLPSQRVLAERLRVNRSTVTAAFDELTAQGLIAGNRGGGTQVINNTWGLMAKQKPADWGAYVEAGQFKPNLPMIRTINQAEFIPDIIRLGTGELSPDLIPSNDLAKLFLNVSTHGMSLGYSEPKGNLRLREEVSKFLKPKGVAADPESVLIVSGALQALQLISIGLLDRGSTIVLEKPSYLYSVHVFQSSGMRFYGLPMDSEGLMVDCLSQINKERGKTIVYSISTFHNPTGKVMTSARRKSILNVCERMRLPIIEDDVYRDLWIDAPPPPSLKSMDHSGNVLYIGSLSKVLSPGLRIGWIVGERSVINRLADIKMQNDYGSSALSQWAAEECMRSGMYEAHASYVRDQLRIRRDYMLDLLSVYFSDLAKWSSPSGGFYVWLKLIPDIDPNTLFECALANGILLNPGVVYDRAASHYLRLSYAYASINEMDQAIPALRKLIVNLAEEKV